MPLSFLDRWFHISRRGSTIAREITAGLTVFGAMAYIVAVNPAILAGAGLDRHDMVMTTIAGAVAGTLLMALWAKLPIALAPAMSSNVLFTQVLIQQAHVAPATAFTVVLFSGLCFTALSLSNIRQSIVRGFPASIVVGIQIAIGAFIARIGLVTAGVALPTAGGFAFGSLANPVVLLALAGIALCAVFTALRVPAGLLIAIIAITVVGLFIPTSHGTVTHLPKHLVEWPHYPTNLVFPFDFRGFFSHLGLLVPITLYFLLSDFFDATATMMTVVHRAGLDTTDGENALDHRAFASDGAASVIGATLGTCTVSAYVESLAGVQAGGRTGLSALVVAVLFLASSVLWPLITSIPSVATAPVLVLVGMGMLESLGRLPATFVESAPPVLMLLITTITGNFMLGLTCGLLLYTALACATRDFRRLTPIVLGLDLAFVLYMVLQTNMQT